ncbi:hypothetical protein [Dyella sp. 20L07]|uniref:hypothetical protein n=1 Tax=Dyella sp. 20L07 TaxID=3384240 RepID=UPI003D2E8A74
MLPAEQSILASWIDGFVERDGTFVVEFQSTFHSAFLELYIFAVLKAQDMSVDLSRPRPDFLVIRPQPIIIEAVTAGIRKDGRSEGERDLDDILSMFVPTWKNSNFPTALIESVVRHSSAISQKALNTPCCPGSPSTHRTLRDGIVHTGHRG